MASDTLIFSDVHGHADNLKRVLDRFPDLLKISLGDMVGTRSNDQTLELLRSHDVHCLRGNHEEDLLHLYDVRPEDRKQIDRWPHRFVEGDLLYCHTALLGDPWRFHDIDSTLIAERMFREQPFRVAFVGHSHSPGWWRWEGAGPPRWKHAKGGSVLKFEQGCRYIVDVGSVGEPRLGTAATYLVLEGQESARWLAL